MNKSIHNERPELERRRVGAGILGQILGGPNKGEIRSWGTEKGGQIFIRPIC